MAQEMPLGGLLSAGLIAIADVQFVSIAVQSYHRELSFFRRLLCTGIRHNRYECRYRIRQD
jgi:hypothetical protein